MVGGELFKIIISFIIRDGGFAGVGISGNFRRYQYTGNRLFGYGIYNLAAPGEVTISDIASELGWYSIPVPELVVDATAEVVARLPFLPAEASWIEALRTPVLMDCAKARRLLRWRPRHDAIETLRQTVAASREGLDGAGEARVHVR